ncbi:hypothetical protein SAMN05444920_12663 [Nonomuraea solani]|uniref:Uncharacterized protein n=1 Tax=Nonomuraea solani TaxID=1144553 RepID=A0A1H6EZV4_9ACTN|nr:hypothetical protein [Nonomuraea solani]SEH02405.1 hypothetical protein SAMN05444920_12663 [Nonomuraea solani]
MTRTATAARRMVSPGHARALANHGPGWAIMWNEGHVQPVIVRPEHGDDGSLLEICTYEEMYTLGRACDPGTDGPTCPACDPHAQPDFDVIAAHMTDILGDIYHDRADIAACMPLTVPYTRALAEHGLHRRFQGVRRTHLFDQLYRSPDGHLIELTIPLPTTPDHAPASPLMIEWTYLCTHPTTPDHPGPESVAPADTPPADIAAMIATHLASHPPTPTTDARNGADVADTPTPA